MDLDISLSFAMCCKITIKADVICRQVLQERDPLIVKSYCWMETPAQRL